MGILLGCQSRRPETRKDRVRVSDESVVISKRGVMCGLLATSFAEIGANDTSRLDAWIASCSTHTF
jgi:hypothetical protein